MKTTSAKSTSAAKEGKFGNANDGSKAKTSEVQRPDEPKEPAGRSTRQKSGVTKLGGVLIYKIVKKSNRGQRARSRKSRERAGANGRKTHFITVSFLKVKQVFFKLN